MSDLNTEHLKISKALGGHSLSTLPPEKIQSLYKHSRKIKLVSAFWVAGIVLLLISLVGALLGGLMTSFDGLEILSLLIFIVPSVLGFLGLRKRTGWGRKLGIVLCFFGLLNFPIGTFISIFGLDALFNSPELFGENKIKHDELKELLGK